MAAPQLAPYASSGRAWSLWAACTAEGGEAGPPGAPALPRARELAASKAADSTAFDPSGSRPHEARPLRPSGDAGLRAGRPRAAGGQVPQGCVDGLASHLERSVLFPARRVVGLAWSWLLRRGACACAAITFWLFYFWPHVVHPVRRGAWPWGRKFSRVATHTARGARRARPRRAPHRTGTPDTSRGDTPPDTSPRDTDETPRVSRPRAGGAVGFPKIRHGRTRESH